ncbi:MAG TPA: sugar ABC transporter ATP-binding protein [Pseudomonas sp.]|uniref:ABC transporter ATP-binding protein n=1 Tax=Pseudomonas sp. Marseille-Q0931 TaxID=2697507 RepID=UPI000ECF747E|nr:ABC transporter ATP-binding protein [Pseudomonas sp. Marseille-Q0931]HBZ95669.1 sugar ABC transporter ATP-binding protein [Pseudomonas sp.]
MSAMLQITNLGKVFRQYRRERHRVLSWLGIPTPGAEEHWALRDISFTLGAGETVGLIGLNGAGKSTLLKIITGTLKPTLGSLAVRGRIAAILELGMGFHPDLSGRQNVYHVAGLMGYTAGQVNELIDDIHAFSEIGEYIDQPVRTYSSGMQVRLAFAVATAWRPDILIVDEALSVGDAYFQHKSFERIRQFSREGTTILLVSHDKQAIQSICDRAILLEHGRVVMQGEPDQVMDYYNAMLAAHQEQKITYDPQAKALLSGTGELVFGDISLLADGRPVEKIDVGQRVHLRVTAHCKQAVPDVVIGFLIKDRYGQDVFGTNTRHLQQIAEAPQAGQQLCWDFEFDASIGPGTYSITLALHSRNGHIDRNYAWQERAIMFEVINQSHPEFAGVAWLGANLECTQHHE